MTTTTPDAVEALHAALSRSSSVDDFSSGAPAEVIKHLNDQGFTITRAEPKTPLGEKLLAIRNRAIANGMQLKTRGEIMNEAPMPDEVVKALNNLANGYDGRGGQYEPTASVHAIRAHIAALSKTIKCQQVDLAGLRKLDFRVTELKEQINLMTKHQAGADEKLCQLDAENKRLVDAIKGVIRVADRKTVEFDEAKAALAQTGDK